MDSERRAHRDRLDELLERAVGEQDDHRHRDGRVGSLGAERDEHGERPCAPGAEERDVGGREVHDRDRSRLGHADDERPQADDDAVERGDGGDAHEIAPQRLQRAADDDVADGPRHAEVAFRPCPDRRAVLQEEEEAQGGEREEDRQRRKGLDPGGHAGEEGVEGVAQPGAGVAVRLLRAVRAHAEILEPGLDLVGALRELRREVGRLARDAPDDHHHESRAQHEQAEEDERRARGRAGARGAGACAPAVTSPRRPPPRRRRGRRSCS